MDYSRNKQNENLGVNKMGKNIKKSPLYQTNYGNNAITSGGGGGRQQHSQPEPQPQVYKINKNEFKSLVQQLTGSPNHPPHRPPQNPPKPQSTRLQKIRPPPLAHVRPPKPVPVPVPAAPVAPPPVTYNNAVLSGPAYNQFTQPLQSGTVTVTPHGDMSWNNVAESPISAYMRYFENSVLDSGSWGNQFQPQPQPQPQLQPPPYPPPSNVQPHLPSYDLLPNPPVQMLPPPINATEPPVSVSVSVNDTITNPPVPVNASYSDQLVSDFPFLQTNDPPILHSPTSQFLLPSPGGNMNMPLPSPQSPYRPLLPPDIQFPSSPNFPFSSPYSQSGFLTPDLQAPLFSPTGFFPMSPSDFFPMSPRWPDI